MSLRSLISVLISLHALPVLAQILALPNAHSHNDYKHENPFYDAINHGFLNIEVDVFPSTNDLVVAHSRSEVDPALTLSSLYLEPLFDIVKSHNGWMFEEDQSLVLLLDFKASPKESLRILRDKIKPYREYLSSYSFTSGFQKRGVTIVVSGERPIEKIVSLGQRWVFLDGRLSDPSNILKPEISPIISCRWQNLFSWNGDGAFPQIQRAKLQRLVSWAHHKGIKLRFWQTPDQENFWKVLYQENVDLIGTDNLSKLKKFLISEMGRW